MATKVKLNTAGDKTVRSCDISQYPNPNGGLSEEVGYAIGFALAEHVAPRKLLSLANAVSVVADFETDAQYDIIHRGLDHLIDEFVESARRVVDAIAKKDAGREAWP